MTSTIINKQEYFQGKYTLARRVSDLFKAEGNKKGPPMLFRHSSMQKIRHCCQNLNLFPYLFYTFGDPKSYPVPVMKMNMCLGFLLARIIERIIRVYSAIRQTIIVGLGLEPRSASSISSTKKVIKKLTPEERQEATKIEKIPAQPVPRFEKFEKQKPKQNPLFLTVAVYFAPLLLAFQLIGILSLLGFGKYTPGFVFLFVALIFLGYILMKVLVLDTISVDAFKRSKRKIE